MVQNIWEKIIENLAFVENSKFIRESTEAAVRGCFGITSQENNCGRVCYSKVAGLMSVSLL